MSTETAAMTIELAAEAVEFGKQAVRALRAAGGDELVREAEADPSRRRDLIEPVLARIGAWELAPRRDPVELEAAAALCRACGYWATPYPVAERLARPDVAVAERGATRPGFGSPGLAPASAGSAPVSAGSNGAAVAGEPVAGLIVVAGPEPAAAVAGLDLRFAMVTPEGRRGALRARTSAEEAPASGRATAFVVPVDIDEYGPVHSASGDADLALVLTLQCWTLLGMLDRALELATEHVLVREQFGRPLAEFQAVQFQLTDAEVERKGVEMLARYAVWSIQSGRSDAVADALALRVAALEAADIVFRVAHQLHGALGFCDESPLSWLSRHSLPLRRLPVGLGGTEELLARRIGARGLTGLFSEPGER